MQSGNWSFSALPSVVSPRAAAVTTRHLDSLDDDGQARSLEAFGVILQMLREATDLRFAAIARVTADSWSACALSSSVVTTLRADQPVPAVSMLCDRVRQSGRPLACNYLASDDDYRDHPAASFYGFQSYVGVPIFLVDGGFFGTLCAMDPLPSLVSSPQTVSMLESLAHLIRMQLDAEDRLRESRAALMNEKDTAELREQFIAVLGHDLRNPLSAVRLGADRLARFSLEAKAAAVVAQIRTSSGRMSALIDSILDFARGQLGGGMQLRLQSDPDLRLSLLQVVSEVQSAHPLRIIEVRESLGVLVNCDGERIAQLLSNLLGNAMHHGSKEEPSLVELASDEQNFTIAVTNHCAPIPAEMAERLFHPFYRRTGVDSHQGLGLGLYIASQIARAHGGTLSVRSDVVGTTFTLNIPVSTGPT